MEKQLRVLVIDDASFMVKAVSELLETDPRIRVVGSAKDGLKGLSKTKALRPDIITLDIDMPVMDGIKAIRHIMIETPVPIVVLSSLFADGAITFEALRLGVVDFIPKPSGAISKDIDKAKQRILDRILLASSINLENVRRVRIPKWDAKSKLTDRYGFQPLDYIITIGTTLTGPNTAIRIFSTLPSNLPAAAVLVKELSPEILPSFVKKFDEYVPWKIEVARDGVVIEQGTCYIGSNENSVSLRVNKKGDPCLEVGDKIDNPLDLLFSSAAETFKQHAIGVLLTGVGTDGADGFFRIKEKSGTTIAQSTNTCVYPNLTQNVIERMDVDIIADEERLSKEIESLLK